MTQPAAGTPVAPAVTRRILDLLVEAQQSLEQARYEGSARRRQDPAPTHGSPWETPDLPQAVMFALLDAQSAVAKVLATAVAHTDTLASA